MFSTLSKTENTILATFYLLSANALNLVKSKILLFGIKHGIFYEGLTLYNTNLSYNYVNDPNEETFF